MARTSFTYNQETCRYEPEVKDSRYFLRRLGVFLGIAMVISVAVFYFYRDQATSMSEDILQSQNDRHKSEWQVLDKRIAHASDELARLIE